MKRLLVAILATLMTLSTAAFAQEARDYSNLVFDDISEEFFYADAVLWAGTRGFSTGVDGENFGPEDALTRADATTLLWRSFGSPAATAGAVAFTDVLAGVYYGLGDAVFEEATKQQSAAGSGATKDTIKALLNQAALHYLRVIYHYNEHAGQRELFGATQGAARVFRSLFSLSGEEDCEAGRRAYNFYRQATDMQQQGEEKRILVSEGLELKARLDEKCKKE